MRAFLPLITTIILLTNDGKCVTQEHLLESKKTVAESLPLTTLSTESSTKVLLIAENATEAPEPEEPVEISVLSLRVQHEILEEQKKFIERFPDPEIPEGAAYAAAYLGVAYFNKSEIITEMENMTAEVRFLQTSADYPVVTIDVYMTRLEPEMPCSLYIGTWGDLVSDEAESEPSKYNHCGGSGPQFLLSNNSEPSWSMDFVTDKFGDYNATNITTTLAPLWGIDSIIGRMVLLQMHENTEHVGRRFHMYLPEGNQLIELDGDNITIACGVVGIGSTFNVSYWSSGVASQFVVHEYCLVAWCALIVMYLVT